MESSTWYIKLLFEEEEGEVKKMNDYWIIEENKRNSDISLIVSNLYKSFGKTRAVSNLSFEVKPGEIYGLLGPNGAGKSTTIKSILGLLEVDSGSISAFGYSPIQNPSIVKELIGYVPEEIALYESMTVAELFGFISSIRNLNPKTTSEIVDRLLRILNAKKYYQSLIASLSKGNKKKIEIISALLHQPRLLILDEPLSGLDARSAVILKKIFQNHIQLGGSILFSTHIMELAQNLCTRIGIINKGKIVAEGTFNELQQMSNSNEASLEEIFLELTDQSEITVSIIEELNRIAQIQSRGKT